jgi:hypothetical protein
MKPAEILISIRVDFGDETLSRTQVYNWCHSEKAGHRLKTCEDYTFYRKNYGLRILGLSSGLKDHLKPTFLSKRRGRSVKSVCLLHEDTCLYITAATTITLEEIYLEVLPHPAYCPDLAPSNFHLFGPIK